MKKFKPFILTALCFLSLNTTIPVYAENTNSSLSSKDTIEDINLSDCTTKIGGFCCAKSDLTLTSSRYYSRDFYTYLTSSWAKASQYTVTKAVTASSSTTGGITFEGLEKLKSKINVSYSKTQSTSTSINTVIPADKNKNSKLAFDIKYYKQNYKEIYTRHYWYNYAPYDQYEKATYTGTTRVPVDSYIYVKYQ